MDKYQGKDDSGRHLHPNNTSGANSSDAASMHQPQQLNTQQDDKRGQQQAGGSSTALDPWAFYGGNIAAACRATNDSVVEQTKGDDNNADEEKRRQRANSRLTAWQSRERKRIEFEVLQERKDELIGRNIRLKKENEQLKALIQHLQATPPSERRFVDTANSIADANQRSLAQRLGRPPIGNMTNQHSSITGSPASAHISLPPSTGATMPSTLGASSFNPSLMATNFARIQQPPAQQQQEDGMLFQQHCLQQHSGVGRATTGQNYFFPSMTRTGTTGTGPTSNTNRRGGITDPPQRSPNLLLSPTPQNSRLPFQRFLGGNDILAPTIFAPLQRGVMGGQEQQQHVTQSSHMGDYNYNQNQQHLQSMAFSPGLPFNLSSLMTPPSDEAIDVPLFRAVQQKRKGESSDDLKKEQRPEKKQQASNMQSKQQQPSPQLESSPSGSIETP